MLKTDTLKPANIGAYVLTESKHLSAPLGALNSLAPMSRPESPRDVARSLQANGVPEATTLMLLTRLGLVFQVG
jgi:hypothetical protein